MKIAAMRILVSTGRQVASLERHVGAGIMGLNPAWIRRLNVSSLKL